MRIESHARSSRGRRKTNQDSLRMCREAGVFVVADGMGGYQGGEVASRLAVDSIVQRLAAAADASAPEDHVRRAIHAANQAIREAQVGPLSDMGSTVALVVATATAVVIGHVGDSRVYRLRAGQLERLTRDHSWVEELGSDESRQVPEATRRMFAHVLTRALGSATASDPDLRTEPLRPHELFLICSDGLTGVLSDARLRDILASEPPATACRTLVDEAYRAGSTDNITAMIVATSPDEVA